MFEILSDKLSGIFRRLSGKGRLTEKDIDEGLREVRLRLEVLALVLRSFWATG